MTLPNNWRPRDYQQPLWDYLSGGGRQAVAIWHRRAGKDDVALHWSAVAAHLRTGTYWHMLPEAAQARKAIWDAVDPHTAKRRIDLAFPPEIRALTRENEMFLRFRNGSTWQVVGSDNFNSLVGSPPVGVVFSEYALANPRAWAYLRPILAENGGWAAFISTPRGRNHLLELHDSAKSRPGQFAEILPATLTNVFSDDQLEDERSSYQADYGQVEGAALFEQEYLCSFEAAIIGAYYVAELRDAREEGRITTIPVDRFAAVETSWDLGYRDKTAIWFFQRIGSRIHVVDHYEAHGVGLAHYVSYLDNWKTRNKASRFGNHYLPHDIAAHEIGSGKSRLQTLYELGMTNIVIVPAHSKLDGINAVRRLFPQFLFDVEKTKQGLNALANYRAVWDEQRKAFVGKDPYHDWTSHSADALRIFASAYDGLVPTTNIVKRRYSGQDARRGSWMSS